MVGRLVARLRRVELFLGGVVGLELVSGRSGRDPMIVGRMS